ncbi:MAG: cytochrome P450 [Treponema sp.]|jgi:electron transport complex protein RnfA|nr:cytochrome P450 [Treponema sp.]
MNQIPVFFLVISSAFTMNLVLQCGLGIKDNSVSGRDDNISILIKMGIIFLTVLLLWVVFSGIFSFISSGIFIYLLIFPVSSMVYSGLEFLFFTYVLKRDSGDECSLGFPGGITAVAVFICVNLANSFGKAAALSFGFSAGTFLVFVILGEIRRRAALEAVPRFLRGKPLVLISMGLLSLVFSTASVLLFKMIEAR